MLFHLGLAILFAALTLGTGLYIRWIYTYAKRHARTDPLADFAGFLLSVQLFMVACLFAFWSIMCWMEVLK